MQFLLKSVYVLLLLLLPPPLLLLLLLPPLPPLLPLLPLLLLLLLLPGEDGGWFWGKVLEAEPLKAASLAAEGAGKSQSKPALVGGVNRS